MWCSLWYTASIRIETESCTSPCIHVIQVQTRKLDHLYPCKLHGAFGQGSDWQAEGHAGGHSMRSAWGKDSITSRDQFLSGSDSMFIYICNILMVKCHCNRIFSSHVKKSVFVIITKCFLNIDKVQATTRTQDWYKTSVSTTTGSASLDIFMLPWFILSFTYMSRFCSAHMLDKILKF